MYKKHFTFFSFLKYREIITVKSLKSKKKKLGTDFVLLCLLRNMVGYLQRPIKILYLPTPARIQKCLT